MAGLDALSSTAFASLARLCLAIDAHSPNNAKRKAVADVMSNGLRPCLEPRCPVLVRAGRCPDHARVREGTRRTGRVLTYTESWWRRWRVSYMHELIAMDIVPACGSRAPSASQHYRTQCQAEGILTFESADGTGLHLHHEPELTELEARDRRIVCDSARVVLACARCHSIRSAGGLPVVPAIAPTAAQPDVNWVRNSPVCMTGVER